MMESRFSDQELTRLLDEALFYTCACPAQVAKMMLSLRQLHGYQRDCAGRADLPETHELIARAVEDAHRRLETCLEEVLRVEGWDRASLSMPEALRQRREAEMDDN